ncbi:hypothetical protein D9M72_413060 [compost metagenome]
MAQPPVADIEARAQPGEERVALRLACVLEERIAVEDVLRRGRELRGIACAVAAVACKVQLVVEHRGGDALVPFLRPDGPARRPLQGGLRDAEREALLAAVVGDGRLGNARDQVDAGFVRKVRQAGKHRHVHAPCVEHAAREARGGVEFAFDRGEADVALAGAAVVERDIDQVRPGEHAVTRGEKRKIGVRLVATDAEKFRIEIGAVRAHLWLRECGHAQRTECAQHCGMER